MRLFLVAGALFAADLLLSLVLPGREATAGTARRLDLPGLVHHSELVLEGHVLSAEPVEAEGLLLTEYLLAVARTFKGPHQAFRALRLPGGVRADGSGLLIPGMPHVVVGEDVLLFLGPESRGMRIPTGLAQGKLGVETMADGRKRLVGDASALALLGGDDTGSSGRSVREYAACVAGIEAALASETRQPARTEGAPR